MNTNKILNKFLGNIKKEQSSFKSKKSFNTFKPLKQQMIADKPVQIFNRHPIPKKSIIEKAYKKIPDDTSIPLQFMTRKQYLKKYVKNQELQNGMKFDEQTKTDFFKNKKGEYNNIIGRYTTKNNSHYPAAVVVFNDPNNFNNIKGDKFDDLVFHEYGHELVEKNNMKMPLMKEEQFADNIADYGQSRKIFSDDRAKNYALKRLNNIQSDNQSKNKIYIPFITKKKNKEPEVYQDVTDETFREEQQYKQNLEDNSYGEVKSYSGEKVGNAMIMADMIIPTSRTLTLAGLGVKKYVDKVKFVKTDEHDNKYKIPKIEIHKKSEKVKWNPEYKNSYYDDTGYREIQSDDESMNSSKPNTLMKPKFDKLNVIYDEDNHYKGRKHDSRKTFRNSLYNVFKKHPDLIKETDNVVFTKNYDNLNERDTEADFTPEFERGKFKRGIISLPLLATSNNKKFKNALNIRHELQHKKQIENLSYDEYDKKFSKEDDLKWEDRPTEHDAVNAEYDYYNKYLGNTNEVKAHSNIMKNLMFDNITEEEAMSQFKHSHPKMKKSIQDNNSKRITQGMQKLGDGASIEKQNEWKDMSEEQRNIERQNNPDTDGDRVPDEYDCQPDNGMRQDFALSEDQYDFDKGKFKYDDNRKVVMMPVDKLYDMRGRYNLGTTTHIFDDYKKEGKIKENIMKASGKKSWEVSGDDVIQHRINTRVADLKQQGYKPQKIKIKNRDVTIKYRRTPNKYKEDMQTIMSPTNIDESRSGSLGDSMVASGSSKIEAGNAERKFHINSMTDAVMNDSAEVPMISIYGSDFKPGGTIGEGRHRILAAKAAGLKEVPVFIDPNNRLPEGALDEYRELTPEEIKQYSNKTRIKGKYKTTKQDIKYSENDTHGFHTTKDFDIGYDDYKPTEEELKDAAEKQELDLLLLKHKILNNDK